LGEYNEVGGSCSWKRCPSFTKGIDRAFCICNLCGSVMHMRQECTWEARLYGGAFIVSQIIKDVYIYCICVFVAVHPATCQRHRTGKRGMGCRPSRRRCEGGQLSLVSHGVLFGPILGIPNRLGLVDLPQLCNVVCQRVVGVWCGEEGLD